MSGKRVTAIGLLVVFFVMIFAGSVLANTENNIFSDVKNGHWAERYIVRMKYKDVISGRPDGTYGINDPVTRLETITLLIRTMGLDDEAEEKNIPTTFKDTSDIPGWGKKYVAMGVIQGLITDGDLYFFRGDEYAKRYEVAEFIGKGMGLESAASSHVSDILPYTDSADIPQSARGYVSLLRAKGIMMGNSDGTFKPQENVTRAEMATLMARLDAYLMKLPEKEISGYVTEVKSSSITVKTDDKLERLTVKENCYIYLDGKSDYLNNISIGDKVIVIKSGSQALIIEAEHQNIETVQGVIKEISQLEDKNQEIVIKTDYGDVTVLILESTLVKIDNSVKDADDLEAGQEVEIEVRGETALIIKADNHKYNMDGVIQEISYTPNIEITIKDEDGENHTFFIDEECDIERNGTDVSLQDLLVGDEVDLEISNNKVTEIDADAVDDEIEGTVKQILIGKEIYLTITDEDDKERQYIINDDTTIKNDDGTLSLLDVKPGDYVELDLESNVITKMWINSKAVLEQITGTVTMVNPDLNILILSVINNGKKESCTVVTNSQTRIVTTSGSVSSKLSRVDEDDIVTVVGETKNQVFTANTIIIISTDN